MEKCHRRHIVSAGVTGGDSALTVHFHQAEWQVYSDGDDLLPRTSAIDEEKGHATSERRATERPSQCLSAMTRYRMIGSPLSPRCMRPTPT